MFGIGAPELIIIAIIALLIFGPSKLPELGKTLGKGLREFKNASSNLKDQINPLSDTGETEEISHSHSERKSTKDNLPEHKKNTAKTGVNKTGKKSRQKKIKGAESVAEIVSRPVRKSISQKNTAKNPQPTKTKIHK